MDSLPERIEAAEGPDRNLDAAIGEATGLFKRMNGTMVRIEGKDSYTAPGNGGPLALVPRYTASIDAAMTLVPEGYALGFKRAPCQRSHAMLATIGYEANASGATPALALCAAALRAKEQPNEG